MITHPTPRTDAAFDKYVTPPYTFGTADIREEMAKLERELAEAKAELELLRADKARLEGAAK